MKIDVENVESNVEKRIQILKHIKMNNREIVYLCGTMTVDSLYIYFFLFIFM